MYILAVDPGTQSVRAAVVSEVGVIEGICRRPEIRQSAASAVTITKELDALPAATVEVR
jgi:sugar (pentulose or hexulose) kinase